MKSADLIRLDILFFFFFCYGFYNIPRPLNSLNPDGVIEPLKRMLHSNHDNHDTTALIIIPKRNYLIRGYGEPKN